jgi:DNA polymerase III psi subunit
MRDDASRARLVEMGFELYVPRGVRAVAAEHVDARKRVALIARDESASARSLLAQVMRALAFARIDAIVAPDAVRIADVAAVVVFGASLAREVGAASAAGQPSIEPLGVAAPTEIAGNPAAKRALWTELKRLVRALAKA